VEPVGHLDADRPGEARRFVETRLDVAARIAAAEVGESDDGAGAAGEFVV
jgi:hypothetical protein